MEIVWISFGKGVGTKGLRSPRIITALDLLRLDAIYVGHFVMANESPLIRHSFRRT